MSEIEWRAVSLGMQRVGTNIQRRPRAHAGPPDPSSQRLSAEEQHRRFWSAEAVKERAERRSEGSGSAGPMRVSCGPRRRASAWPSQKISRQRNGRSSRSCSGKDVLARRRGG
jgi:hypothetical protein